MASLSQPSVSIDLQRPQVKRKRKVGQTSVDVMTENPDNHGFSSTEKQVNKTNRHMAFMEAILPSIECFDEMDILEFQTQVLQIVKKMRIEKGYK